MQLCFFLLGGDCKRPCVYASLAFEHFVRIHRGSFVPAWDRSLGRTYGEQGYKCPYRRAHLMQCLSLWRDVEGSQLELVVCVQQVQVAVNLKEGSSQTGTHVTQRAVTDHASHSSRHTLSLLIGLGSVWVESGILFLPLIATTYRQSSGK